MPRPSYPLFEHLTRARGRGTRAYDLEISRRVVDRHRQRRARGRRRGPGRCWSSARTTRPGRSSRATELDRLAAICAPRGIALIADEVFADYELEPGARGGAGRVARPRRRADVCARRTVEVGRPAAGQARMDCGRRARTRSSTRRSSGSNSCATPICRSRRRCSWRRRSCSTRGARRPRADRGAHRRELPALQTARRAAAPACRVLRADGGWYAVVQVPTIESEEELVVDLPDPRRRAGASRHIFSIFRASRFWSSACCRAKPRSPTASTALLAAFRLQRYGRPR